MTRAVQTIKVKSKKKVRDYVRLPPLCPKVMPLCATESKKSESENKDDETTVE